MGRTLSNVMGTLPKERRRKVLARFEELKDLQALRTVAGKVQAKVAETLHISQPSVSKIEKQTDMYLSTLKNYVHAIGGELELIITLPSQGSYQIRSIGALAQPSSKSGGLPKRAVKSKKRVAATLAR